MLRRALRIFATAMNFQRTTTPQQARQTAPTIAEASRFWLKFGFISFGGPTAQIALLHGELVEKKKWISESRFFHALNFCMLLPGPEAHQLAIYIGWLLHKVRGGVAAVFGLVGGKIWKAKFLVFGQQKAGRNDDESVLGDDVESPAHTKPSLAGAIKTCAVWLTLWWLPVVILGVWRGWNDTLFREGLFFSKAAVVTLGGAYAVLQYVAQNAVEYFHW